MKRVLAYTISRANTPQRGRLLLDTLTHGSASAGMSFDWYLYANSKLAAEIGASAKSTGTIKKLVTYDDNVGQHIPTNEAIHTALEGDYDYLLRIDDDVEFETKRWLVKLIEASTVMNDIALISPRVRGLKYPPTVSELRAIDDVPIRLTFEAMGGICRLHPMGLLKTNPYLTDTRQPMGFGDATGIGRWAQLFSVPMIYVQTVNVKHAKGTKGQEKEDVEHFLTHGIFQRCPYIPAWRPDASRDAITVCGEPAQL